MTSEPTFSIAARVRSFGHAANGLRLMLVSQHNAWIHAAATLAACTLGAALGLGRLEWCWLVIAIVSVWTAEALNTAFELLCDVASPDFHPRVKQAKDVAAGAVLVSAAGALAIGLAILGPRLLALV
jgi:diacylglycerol kinase (ATP)